jgi:hypothetical protein
MLIKRLHTSPVPAALVTDLNEILHSEMEVNPLRPKEQRSAVSWMRQRNPFPLSSQQHVSRI